MSVWGGAHPASLAPNFRREEMAGTACPTFGRATPANAAIYWGFYYYYWRYKGGRRLPSFDDFAEGAV